MPLKNDLIRADGIEVVGDLLPEKYLVTDLAEVRDFVKQFLSLDDNWRNYWASLPMHEYDFEFFEGDQKLAWVAVGESWIFKDGLIRDCTEEEAEALTGKLPKRKYERNFLEK